MDQNPNKKRKTVDDWHYIEFWGGKKLLFSLLVFIMIGILIMIFNQISFIFKPLQVIFSTMIAPIILAVVFFNILNPLVSWMEKKGVKRLVGTVVVFVSFLVVLGYGIILLVPILSEQVSEFAADFPEYVATLNTRLEDFISGSMFETYYRDALNSLDGIVGKIPSFIMDWIGSSSQKIVNVFSTISNVVVIIVTFPIILFFMLTDRGKFEPFVMQFIPPVFRKDTRILSSRVSTTVRSYIQGEFFVALSLGILLLVGYLLIGLDYAFVLATIATVTAIIPFIGATIGILPAVVVAAFSSPAMLLKMALVWGVSQFIQGNIIEPNILGKNLKIHPLTIIIVLLIMGNLLGIIGMILGVPLFAILKIFLEFFFEKFKKRYNFYFSGEAGPYTINPELAGDTNPTPEKTEQTNSK